MRKRKITFSKTPILQNAASACARANSYDIIGDIAIMRLRVPHPQSQIQKTAHAIMSIHKNLKTVLAQTGAVCGDFRLRQLKYVTGERKAATRHRESGCLFSVDVEKCFFSPRLSYERMRVAQQVGKSEVVVNMFAGAGCFSILVGKYSDADIVYSFDINPEAVNYMRENVRINRLYGKVVPILGDAKGIIEKRVFHVADRVLMPLPEKAFEYLPYALLALKKTGGLIHYYDFAYARKDQEAVEKIRLKVSQRLQSLGVNFQIIYGRVVRSTGPHWWQVVIDVEIAGQ